MGDHLEQNDMDRLDILMMRYGVETLVRGLADLCVHRSEDKQASNLMDRWKDRGITLFTAADEIK